MLTYDFSNAEKPLYQYLYRCIKADILSGKLQPKQKLPSKRSLARNLGVSTITVETAYDQLIGEGYVTTLPKQGYYVARLPQTVLSQPRPVVHHAITLPKEPLSYRYDFSSNETSPDSFPFSVWAKLMRDTISNREAELLKPSPCGGVRLLREAIAGHLHSFRGMLVDPDQIVVGAGTEYLYTLLVKLLGKEKRYCIENPGYRKIEKIYAQEGVACAFADLDEDGVTVSNLEAAKAQIAHISPNHHFPTGIHMPISRRYALLSWANQEEGRYIIEDDYDSEFRRFGKPVPPLQSIDASEKVIYINTFSKTLASTIRISYMVLPIHLANAYYEKLSFYSCTVPTFEQYTLAKFILQGYLEKHINRMRLFYGRKRQRILEHIHTCFSDSGCRIIEENSGLHFLLELQTTLSDTEIENKLRQEGIRLQSISHFYHGKESKDSHRFILNYSNLPIEGLETALQSVRKIAAGNGQ